MTQAQSLILAGLHAGLIEDDPALSGSGYFTQSGEFLSIGQAAQYVKKALFPGARSASTPTPGRGAFSVARNPNAAVGGSNEYVSGSVRYTIQPNGSVTVSRANPLTALFGSGRMTYAQKLAYQLPMEQGL